MREIEFERTRASTTSWSVDPERSRVEFVLTRRGMEEMRGCVPAMTGTLVIDDEDPSRSSAVIAVETARARVERPLHVERKLFSVSSAARPTVRFASRAVQPAGEGRFRVYGTLVAGDALRMITFYVKAGEREYDVLGDERLPLRAITTLDLADERGRGGIPFDEIAVLIETEFVRSGMPVNAA